jgi:hypothetical protein
MSTRLQIALLVFMMTNAVPPIPISATGPSRGGGLDRGGRIRSREGPPEKNGPSTGEG